MQIRYGPCRRTLPVILIDSRIGSKELIPYVRRVGCKVEEAQLEYGDACFEGNGPNGKVVIGIERKTLGDILNCIDDARYSAHQRPGMAAMYQRSILMIEGIWKPDTTSGYMMSLIRGINWSAFRYRSRMVPYNKLFRYLLSIQLTGTIVIITQDIEHTAFNICECFYYFQKRWEDHTALLATQTLNIPDLRIKPSLLRRWAAQLEGIGVKNSMAAEKIFTTPYDLARGDEMDWCRIPGVGPKVAKRIVRSIHGND